jgi:hypothetical protein
MVRSFIFQTLRLTLFADIDRAFSWRMRRETRFALARNQKYIQNLNREAGR